MLLIDLYNSLFLPLINYEVIKNYSSIKLIYLSSIILVDDIKLISVCLFLVIIINISSINGIVINDNEFKIT